MLQVPCSWAGLSGWLVRCSEPCCWVLWGALRSCDMYLEDSPATSFRLGPGWSVQRRRHQRGYLDGLQFLTIMNSYYEHSTQGLLIDYSEVLKPPTIQCLKINVWFKLQKCFIYSSGCSYVCGMDVKNLNVLLVGFFFFDEYIVSLLISFY